MKLIKGNSNILIIGILCSIFIFINSIFISNLSYSMKEDTPIIVDKVQVIEKNKYRMEIKYPQLRDNEINKKIKNFLNGEKKLFKTTIKDIDKYENELNINYSYSIKDNLYSIYIRSYYYINDTTYHRNDMIIYYDVLLNKEINSNEIITNNMFYEVIRNTCYDYLLSNKDKYKIYDNEIVNKRLVADSSNYKLINFNEDNIQIVFEPNSVSEYDNEIVIDIKYNKIINYLNSKYFSIEDTVIDVDTNNVVRNYERIRESKRFENKKLIALTFDDGPAYSKTDKLITELEKRDARVTFFMLGELAIRQKDLVKKVYSMGHTIGSHTYDHKNLKKLDNEKLTFEIEYTNEILKDIIGEDIRFIRPPYGSYNQDILNNTNMAFILWNVDTLDWKYRNAEKVRDYIVKTAKDGDIILLHDIHSTSVDGAIMAIDILKEQGYEFVSLDELLIYRNINIQNRKAYRFFK